MIPREFLGFGSVFFCLLATFQCGAGAAELELREIADDIATRFASVQSIYVKTRISFPSQDDKPNARVYEWAQEGGNKIMRSESRRITGGMDIGEIHPMYKSVLDDGLGLTVGYDPRDAPRQVRGGILNESNHLEEFYQKAPLLTEFGRACGWMFSGKNIAEWLSQSSASFVGEELRDGEICNVITVTNEIEPGLSEDYTFFLLKGKGNALYRFEVRPTTSSPASLIGQNFDFAELDTGLWFPMKGRTGENDWEVLELIVNKPVPDGKFDLTFQDGLYVFDGRFGVDYIWNSNKNMVSGIVDTSSLDQLLEIHAKSALVSKTLEAETLQHMASKESDAVDRQTTLDLRLVGVVLLVAMPTAWLLIGAFLRRRRVNS